ncbi:hypothetical protein Sme01_13950 [Sphaerisporangium melleum]|uniref:non-specific serine/threonine protein kinase n=1 Tax=Sphaerisporangium melleum TaxID=321316 RepID=A0A917QUG9_9ACTN|nr:serine/threonine-protein kinase [Sphaerisporangium melleum]GGK68687.1 hypothetical protein GCM10007964_09560 [Sphaerisporangium melleum]GII68919.1 hypothetical protein Sme01_13950 [Sphaerisporangium melleum]
MPEQQKRLIADRYELIAALGRGTMGTVWRAHDRLLGRDVAVKEIRQDAGLSTEQRDELRERMIREGRNAAKIVHPSVATVHDAILVDGSPWIVMELVEARSLQQVIDEEGPLPPRLVAEIGLDLLGALGAAHKQGVLHRDVKPGNVLLTDTGRVVLTDFGIAKSEGDSSITRTGMVIGSPGYTAPERARGDHTGPESDLWSLGATLYFAVEGRPAYERATVGETLAALMTEQADPAAQAGPLRPALEGLLEKDHTKRLGFDLAVAMLRRVAKTPSSASPPPSSTPASPPSSSTPASTSVPSSPTPTSSAPSSVSAPPAASSADAGPSSPSAAGRGPSSTPAGPRTSRPSPAASAPRPAPSASHPDSGPSGAAAGPSRQGPAGEDADAEQTMVVIRPKGGLRIPGSASDADEDALSTMVGGLPPVPATDPNPSRPPRPGQDTGPSHQRPARPGPQPGKGAPHAGPSPYGRPSGSGPGRAPHAAIPDTPPAGPDRAHDTGGRYAPGRPGAPQAYAPGGPGASQPPGAGSAANGAYGATGTAGGPYADGFPPDNGLGTDLFSLSTPPKGGSRAGIIVLAVVAVLGLVTIVVLLAAAMSGGD